MSKTPCMIMNSVEIYICITIRFLFLILIEILEFYLSIFKSIVSVHVLINISLQPHSNDSNGIFNLIQIPKQHGHIIIEQKKKEAHS